MILNSWEWIALFKKKKKKEKVPGEKEEYPHLEAG